MEVIHPWSISPSASSQAQPGPGACVFVYVGMCFTSRSQTDPTSSVKPFMYSAIPPCHPLGPRPVLGISGHSKRTLHLLVSGRQNWTEKLPALNGQVWVKRRSPRLGSQQKKTGQPGVIMEASWKKSPILEGHKSQTDPQGNAGRPWHCLRSNPSQSLPPTPSFKRESASPAGPSIPGRSCSVARRQTLPQGEGSQ